MLGPIVHVPVLKQPEASSELEFEGAACAVSAHSSCEASGMRCKHLCCCEEQSQQESFYLAFACTPRLHVICHLLWVGEKYFADTDAAVAGPLYDICYSPHASLIWPWITQPLGRLRLGVGYMMLCLP